MTLNDTNVIYLHFFILDEDDNDGSLGEFDMKINYSGTIYSLDSQSDLSVNST